MTFVDIEKLTIDELVAAGWAVADANLLMTDPNAMIERLIGQGWPRNDAEIRVRNPLLAFDVILDSSSD